MVAMHGDQWLGGILSCGHRAPAVWAKGALHVATVGKQSLTEGVGIEWLGILEDNRSQCRLMVKAYGAGHVRHRFGCCVPVDALGIDFLESAKKRFVFAIED
jgi:hypothetical protein